MKENKDTYEKILEYKYEFLKDGDSAYNDKQKIHVLMENIIPLLKQIKPINFFETKGSPYRMGLYEAWLHAIRVSTRTTDKNKISSLLYNIESYVNYYL